MKKTNFDYHSEVLAFLKLKSTGERITIKGYCQKRAGETDFRVSYQYFKRTLAKIRRDRNPKLNLTKNTPASTAPSLSSRTLLADPQWPVLRESYIKGHFASLSDVARHLGLRPDHKGFREAVKGWRDERRDLKPAISAKTAEQLARGGAMAAARDLYADALVAHYKLLDLVTDSALNAKERWKDRDKTPWHTHMAAQAAMDLAKAMAQLLPAIRGLENLQTIHSIFDKLSAGGDIVTAALDLAKLGVALPKPVEILLTKHKADELPPDDGQVISDEAIVARRAKILAEIEAERNTFLPERKRIVAELKAATADSFRAQREIETEP